MILFIKLLLAHLIGDFILQPNSCIKAKEERKLRSYWFYIHILLHGLLAFLIVWDVTFWLSALVIASTHGIIDAAKVLFQEDRYKRQWFLIDQGLHIAVIIAVSCYWQDITFSFDSIITERGLIFFTAALAITFPASVTIRTFISKWAPHIDENKDDSFHNTNKQIGLLERLEDGSLQDAGKYIGILERLFVLMFIIIGHWEAIGFLIAAKSIFRFGDLKESKDRKLTEYILIGTLLSFGVALTVGILARIAVQSLP